MRNLLVLLWLTSAVAADPERAAGSLDKQRQSVERQLRRYRQPGSFFLSPWLDSQQQPPRPPAPPAPAPAPASDCEPLPEAALATLIATASRESGLNPQLLRAVIRRESGGRPCATSSKGAQGLMQLMPATSQALGLADPFDPAANLAGGARYLSDLLKRYNGDLRRALAAYNAGPQRVAPEGELPNISETQAYVEAILADTEPQPSPTP